MMDPGGADGFYSHGLLEIIVLVPAFSLSTK